MSKVKSPFRYAGGKFYALKHLLPFVNSIEHREYREPFVGGGSVFFGKNPAEVSWINDIDSELIHIYQTMTKPDLLCNLISKLDKEVASRERHNEVKELEPINDFERAFKYFYLNRTSYSGIMKKPAWGYKVGKSSPPENWGNMLIKSAPKLEGVQITDLDYEEVITADSDFSPDEVLLYLDPPYIVADQKRAYINSFTIEEHFRLQNLLKNTKFKFLLSYDDSSEVRELYDWAYFTELNWNYNTSNISGEKRKKGNELLISNFPLQNLNVVESRLPGIEVIV
jgi:DNA adenine methylase